MQIKMSSSAMKGLAAILTIACIGGGTVYAGSVVSKNNLIGEDAAEEFAILDADITWDEVSGLHTYLERAKGRYVYDIEFHASQAKYEYEILAEDGSVLDKEVKTSGTRTAAEQTDSRQKEETDLQADDGRQKEETDLQAAGIQQTEGAVLQAADRDAEKTTGSANTSDEDPDTDSGQDTGNAEPAAPQTESKPRYLSVDEAKKIALDHAGLTEDQVRFSTAKFDDDDSEGEEYEIEFYSGNTEYEYEIDARTGDIRDFSKEVDDDDD